MKPFFSNLKLSFIKGKMHDKLSTKDPNRYFAYQGIFQIISKFHKSNFMLNEFSLSDFVFQNEKENSLLLISAPKLIDGDSVLDKCNDSDCKTKIKEKITQLKYKDMKFNRLYLPNVFVF